MSWLELPDDDQPPQHMWLDPDAIDDHFTWVMAKHKNGGGSDGPADPGEQNEMTRGVRD